MYKNSKSSVTIVTIYARTYNGHVLSTLLLANCAYYTDFKSIHLFSVSRGQFFGDLPIFVILFQAFVPYLFFQFSVSIFAFYVSLKSNKSQDFVSNLTPISTSCEV